ncbi:MAG: hypothetical protein ACK414_12170, partial [Gemmobacter sp.]
MAEHLPDDPPKARAELARRRRPVGALRPRWEPAPCPGMQAQIAFVAAATIIDRTRFHALAGRGDPTLRSFAAVAVRRVL